MTDIMGFIREERIKQKVTRKQMAYEAMVDPATIYLWEHYRFVPKFEAVETMLDVLGYKLKVIPKDEPQTDCLTCRYNSDKWDSPKCDSCSKAHSNYEPQPDCQWK